MNAQQRRDERLNVLAFIAALLTLPAVVGAISGSWVAALVVLVVVETIVAAVAFAHMDGQR